MAQGVQEQPLPRRWRGQARPPTAQLAHDDMASTHDNQPTTIKETTNHQTTKTMSQPAKQGQSGTTAHSSATVFLPANFVTCSLRTLLSLVSARPFSDPPQAEQGDPQHHRHPRAQHRPCTSTKTAPASRLLHAPAPSAPLVQATCTPTKSAKQKIN